MSTVSVSYRSLKDASNEANSVAKKLNSYADSIDRHVYNKLNKYKGEWTSNIYAARNSVATKYNELRTAAGKYKTYADNLIDLRDECKSVDKAVKSKVSSLTGTFKNAYGIKVGKVESAVTGFFTGLRNSCSAGRWTGDKIDQVRNGGKYIKDGIKEWYDYGGGKELIKGLLVGILEIAIAVLGIVAVVLSGGAILGVVAVIAGVVGGVIAIVNGAVNIGNEIRAYRELNRYDDPATAKRLRDQNTIQDTLREGNISQDSNGFLDYIDSHVSISKTIANVIDGVNLVCTVITVVDSLGKLAKNAYKWATNNPLDIKEISMKDVLTKDSFTKIFSRIKSSALQGLKDIGSAIKRMDLRFFLNGAKDFGSDFMNNMKGEFFKFDKLKSGVSSVKNILGVAKVLVEHGLDGEGIKGLVEKIVVPGITLAVLPYKLEFPEGGGQGYLNFDDDREKIKVKDFYKLYDDIKKKVVGNDLFSQPISVDMNLNVLDKLSTTTDINISIPDIQIPKIEIPTVAVQDLIIPEITVSAA